MTKPTKWGTAAEASAEKGKKATAVAPPEERWIAVGTYLPESVHADLKVYAAKTKKKIREVVAEAVARYLETEGKG